MQEVLLDSLLRILANFTLHGSFSSKEEAVLRQLLLELGVEPQQEMHKIQQYMLNSREIEPVLLARNVRQRLPRPLRYLLFAYVLQLAYSDRVLREEEQRLINILGAEFEITPSESVLLQLFAQESRIRGIDSPQILIVGAADKEVAPSVRHLQLNLPGYIAFLYLPSVELTLMRLVGPRMEAHLNGQWIHGDVIRVFPEGALLRVKGYTLTYKEIIEQFRPAPFQERVLWEVRKVSYKFKNGRTAIHPVSFEVSQGRLVGIMGPSGAGKSTLMRLLSGQLRPSSGKVYLNAIDIHNNPKAVQGLLGYVPQEDLLIEELTVWENVYYAARLAYDTDEEAQKATETTLRALGLQSISDLPVGSPLNPVISGGQRKRVNIALEVVRGPLVLFVDEPTSGLSSSDALQVVEVLQSLAKEGRIVFFTLHQPSSEIYKKLDQLLFLDEGGYAIYWGAPVAGLQHFRRASGISDSEQVECPSCRRVEPESLFDIIQARRIDERGKVLPQRHVPPERWYQIFWRDHSPPKTQVDVPTPKPHPPASPMRQWQILLEREGLRRWRNRLASSVLLLAAPILGLIVGTVLRYHPPDQPYTLYENDSFPTALFTNILAIIFLGMLSTAEDLLKDRKIRLREAFLHLSWSSYLHAKLFWVILFSALQVTLYWGIVSLILGSFALWGATWLLLFIVALVSNLLSLNLSDAFTQPIPVYILIPILIIPQIVLSGAVIPFDKFNPLLKGERPVPFMADLSLTRWAYEAQVVLHFSRNPYERHLYPIHSEQSFLRYHLLYELPERRARGDTTAYLRLWGEAGKSMAEVESYLRTRLQQLNGLVLQTESQLPPDFRLRYHNDALEKIALATQTSQKFVAKEDKYIRLYEPAYINQPQAAYLPFFSAIRCIGDTCLSTPTFDLLVLVGMGLILWMLLEWRVLNKLFLGGRP
ncbi:MAG: ATP-binding cassette domain-containing protein [Bacteroidia bacterium]|nr:ATP-binding cassette domain-containing protein [Bacteroidia bacterium]MDW8236234.1 ATP-binding cassette domain-containing protein [Bacteroidia bacterium]